MKYIDEIKLNALADANLLEIEMNCLLGGKTCGCSCSSNTISSNREANYNIGSGGYATSGCSQYLYSDLPGGGVVYSTCTNCDASLPWRP